MGPAEGAEADRLVLSSKNGGALADMPPNDLVHGLLNAHSWYRIETPMDYSRAGLWCVSNLATALVIFFIPNELRYWRKVPPFATSTLLGSLFIAFYRLLRAVASFHADDHADRALVGVLLLIYLPMAVVSSRRHRYCDAQGARSYPVGAGTRQQSLDGQTAMMPESAAPQPSAPSEEAPDVWEEARIAVASLESSTGATPRWLAAVSTLIVAPAAFAGPRPITSMPTGRRRPYAGSSTTRR